MTLYEIDRKITEALARAIDPETGELTDEAAMEALDGLQMERTAKLENIALYAKNLTAEAAAIKAEEQALKSRREAAEHKAARMRDYLAYGLGGERLTTPRVAVSYRRSSKVIIDDLDQIPAEFIRTKTTTDADKAALKAAIKAGESIAGVHMEETQNLQIR